MKPGLTPDRPVQGEAAPRSSEEGRAARVLVPVLPPCCTSRRRGSRASGKRRARGRRDRGLVLGLPPPIRFRLPDTEPTPPEPHGTRPGGPIPPR